MQTSSPAAQLTSTDAASTAKQQAPMSSTSPVAITRDSLDGGGLEAGSTDLRVGVQLSSVPDTAGTTTLRVASDKLSRIASMTPGQSGDCHAEEAVVMEMHRASSDHDNLHAVGGEVAGSKFGSAATAPNATHTSPAEIMAEDKQGSVDPSELLRLLPDVLLQSHSLGLPALHPAVKNATQNPPLSTLTEGNGSTSSATSALSPSSARNGPVTGAADVIPAVMTAAVAAGAGAGPPPPSHTDRLEPVQHETKPADILDPGAAVTLPAAARSSSAPKPIDSVGSASALVPGLVEVSSLPTLHDTQSGGSLGSEGHSMFMEASAPSFSANSTDAVVEGGVLRGPGGTIRISLTTAKTIKRPVLSHRSEGSFLNSAVPEGAVQLEPSTLQKTTGSGGLALERGKADSLDALEALASGDAPLVGSSSATSATTAAVVKPLAATADLPTPSTSGPKVSAPSPFAAVATAAMPAFGAPEASAPSTSSMSSKQPPANVRNSSFATAPSPFAAAATNAPAFEATSPEGLSNPPSRRNSSSTHGRPPRPAHAASPFGTAGMPPMQFPPGAVMYTPMSWGNVEGQDPNAPQPYGPFFSPYFAPGTAAMAAPAFPRQASLEMWPMQMAAPGQMLQPAPMSVQVQSPPPHARGGNMHAGMPAGRSLSRQNSVGAPVPHLSPQGGRTGGVARSLSRQTSAVLVQPPAALTAALPPGSTPVLMRSPSGVGPMLVPMMMVPPGFAYGPDGMLRQASMQDMHGGTPFGGPAQGFVMAPAGSAGDGSQFAWAAYNSHQQQSSQFVAAQAPGKDVSGSGAGSDAQNKRQQGTREQQQQQQVRSNEASAAGQTGEPENKQQAGVYVPTRQESLSSLPAFFGDGGFPPQFVSAGMPFWPNDPQLQAFMDPYAMYNGSGAMPVMVRQESASLPYAAYPMQPMGYALAPGQAGPAAPPGSLVRQDSGYGVMGSDGVLRMLQSNNMPPFFAPPVAMERQASRGGGQQRRQSQTQSPLQQGQGLSGGAPSQFGPERAMPSRQDSTVPLQQLLALTVMPSADLAALLGPARQYLPVPWMPHTMPPMQQQPMLQQQAQLQLLQQQQQFAHAQQQQQQSQFQQQYFPYAMPSQGNQQGMQQLQQQHQQSQLQQPQPQKQYAPISRDQGQMQQADEPSSAHHIVDDTSAALQGQVKQPLQQQSQRPQASSSNTASTITSTAAAVATAAAAKLLEQQQQLQQQQQLRQQQKLQQKQSKQQTPTPISLSSVLDRMSNPQTDLAAAVALQLSASQVSTGHGDVVPSATTNHHSYSTGNMGNIFGSSNAFAENASFTSVSGYPASALASNALKTSGDNNNRSHSPEDFHGAFSSTRSAAAAKLRPPPRRSSFAGAGEGAFAGFSSASSPQLPYYPLDGGAGEAGSVKRLEAVTTEAVPSQPQQRGRHPGDLVALSQPASPLGRSSGGGVGQRRGGRARERRRSHSPAASSGGVSFAGSSSNSLHHGGTSSASIPPEDPEVKLKWCHVQHSKKQMPKLSPKDVKELVAAQLQSKEPIRPPWYRDHATAVAQLTGRAPPHRQPHAAMDMHAAAGGGWKPSAAGGQRNSSMSGMGGPGTGDYPRNNSHGGAGQGYAGPLHETSGKRSGAPSSEQGGFSVVAGGGGGRGGQPDRRGAASNGGSGNGGGRYGGGGVGGVGQSRPPSGPVAAGNRSFNQGGVGAQGPQPSCLSRGRAEAGPTAPPPKPKGTGFFCPQL